MKKHVVDLDPEDGEFSCVFCRRHDSYKTCEHPGNRNPKREDGQELFLLVDMDECPHEYRAPMDAEGVQATMYCAAPTCPLRKEPIQVEGKARLEFTPCKRRRDDKQG